MKTNGFVYESRPERETPRLTVWTDGAEFKFVFQAVDGGNRIGFSLPVKNAEDMAKAIIDRVRELPHFID